MRQVPDRSERVIQSSSSQEESELSAKSAQRLNSVFVIMVFMWFDFFVLLNETWGVLGDVFPRKRGGGGVLFLFQRQLLEVVH